MKRRQTSGIRQIAKVLLVALLLCSCAAKQESASLVSHSLSSTYDLDLTAEEAAYLETVSPLQVAVNDGGAPLFYFDSQGNPGGIGIRVMQEIAARSGLPLYYKTFKSVSAVWESDADLLPTIDPRYLVKEMLLSTPYLSSDAVLYMRQGIDINTLANKRVAVLESGTPPEGIAAEQIVFFESREKAVEGVNRGLADYGYGNIFSLSYLLLTKNLQNIVMVPQGFESRRYSVGVMNGDPILLSIIDKAIASLSEDFILSIVLDEASRVASDVSLSVLMSRYGAWIFVISLITIAILLLLSYGVARSRKLLRYQNRRYELLFELSEGYLFEFSLDEQLLSLSPQSSSLQAQYHLPEERIIEYLKEITEEDESGQISTALTLHDINGKMATYRLQMFRQKKEAGMQGDWIGLLSDISADEKEKAALRNQADTDGLTGVLNQVALRKQVERVLQSREDGSFDVFILLDFDNFKEINDTYGHLEGNHHLQGLASLLETLFPDAEVLGRVGGDEFGLYLNDMSSLDEARELAEAINPAYQRRLESSFTLSVGVAKVEKGDTFDTLFNRADVALYASKRAGGNTITLRQ